MSVLLLLNILLVSLFNSYQELTFIPVSSGEQISHKYYILSYNEDTEQANWVYYKLTKEMLQGDAQRNSSFRNDPLVTTKSASTKDYTMSGYDRGHLCPAADMKFDDTAMYESFYMSNVSPQIPEFNRGIWKELESQVRNWTYEKDSLYVITGPIFDDVDVRIGKNEVRVPKYLFKILYDAAYNQMIAFTLPNIASDQPFTDFVVSVDSLESLTNIDFFSQLPDSMENRLEKRIQLSSWFKDIVDIKNKGRYSTNYTSPIILLVAVMVIILLITIIQIKRK
jgi:endonuclease G